VIRNGLAELRPMRIDAAESEQIVDGTAKQAPCCCVAAFRTPQNSRLGSQSLL